ncbi:MAG TPA: DUF3108 domain-containing protein [Burkholderiaceae bacterium]|nr:DUF3108 domain-containing protein [Burkholderiaceae bacterium]
MVLRLSSDPPSPGRRRARLLVLATLVVLALHGVLLFGLAPAWIDPDDTPAAPPRLSVRSVAAPAAIVAEAPIPAAPVAAPQITRPARAPKAALPATEPPAAPVAPAPDALAASTPGPVPPPEAVVAESAPAPSAIELPVYATRLPAAGRWRYQLQRGIAAGEADLGWAPAGDGRYELRLEGRIAGVTVLDWVSRGTVDAHGLAPDRFSVRRRGRDHQAANFQREAGKITFSGPTYELPLLPGVQDRLGWLLQLPAVIDAAPGQFGPGSRVVLMVVGARGGADVWTFTVVGHDRVADTPALKLLREARRPRDTQVEIWLDPARGHLPLRALLTQPDGGPPLELQLDTPSTGP